MKFTYYNPTKYIYSYPIKYTLDHNLKLYNYIIETIFKITELVYTYTITTIIGHKLDINIIIYSPKQLTPDFIKYNQIIYTYMKNYFTKRNISIILNYSITYAFTSSTLPYYIYIYLCKSLVNYKSLLLVILNLCIVNNIKIKGFKCTLTGCLSKTLRTQKFKISSGQTNKQSIISSYIIYTNYIKTMYGLIGFKFWCFF